MVSFRFVGQSSERIRRLRAIQVGIYALHIGLLIIGLAYAALDRDLVLALVVGLFASSMLRELRDIASALRGSTDDLQVVSIEYRSLRWLDWLMISVFAALTLAEVLILWRYDPGQRQIALAWVPLLLNMLLGPLVVFGWLIGRVGRRVLLTFVRSGFRFPPPDSEFWIGVRSESRNAEDPHLVFVLYIASLGLQFLLLVIWGEGSASSLLLWGIVSSGLLTNVLLARKLGPALPASR